MKLSLRINPQDLQAYHGWFLAWGVALFILGLLAVSAATFTTVVSMIFIGLMITFAGAVILVDTFTFWWKRWSGFLIHLVLSLLYIFVGLTLINDPALASTTLTLLLGVFYLCIGVSRIFYALSMRSLAKWQWRFLNGFVSFLLGLLILTNLPAASLFVIGLFVGIDLLFSGIAYIMMAMASRRLLG